MKQGNLAERHL